jgi:hypothetical protein
LTKLLFIGQNLEKIDQNTEKKHVFKGENPLSNPGVLGVSKSIANHDPDNLGNDLQAAIARMKNEKIMKQKQLDQIKGEKKDANGYKIVLGGMEPTYL